MFTVILQRNSWLIYKVGMPLVYFYHLLMGNVFINTAAEDAKGIEWLANVALMPTQFLLEGKKAIPISDQDGNLAYRLERRFDYEHHFFLKTAVATTTLPLSIAAGSTLKTLAYLFPQTRERADQIYSASHSTAIPSNCDYYRSINLEVNDYRMADSIAPPKWERRPRSDNPLKADMEALKEIIALLTEHEIPFWIDRGSCLGIYQHGGLIPTDWDIDLAILQRDFQAVKNVLHQLDPEKYIVQDWSGRAIPESYLKVYVRQSGGLIDIFNFGIDEESQQLYTIFSNQSNIFAPDSWMIRENRYINPMPFSYIFPLKQATYEGITVPVPGQIENYLHVFYGENLAPVKFYNEATGRYEKDLSHPHWKKASAY